MAKARRSSISQRRRARVGARIRSCFRYHFPSSVYHAPRTTPSSSHLIVWSTSTIQRLQRPHYSHIIAGPRSLSKAVLRFVCFAAPSALFFRTCGSAPPNLAFAFELPGRPTSDLRGRDQKRSPVFRVAWFCTILRLLHTICSPRGQQRISTRSPRVLQEQTLYNSARVSSEARSCCSPSHVSTACFCLAVPPAPGTLSPPSCTWLPLPPYIAISPSSNLEAASLYLRAQAKTLLRR
jgi:hypothetical protein